MMKKAIQILFLLGVLSQAAYSQIPDVVQLEKAGAFDLSQILNNTKVIVQYLNSTIEAESLGDPDQSCYNFNLKASEIEKTRRLLWDCWIQANQVRLNTWPKLKEGEVKDSLLWQLPGEQQMLHSVLKKGSRPVEGYPLFINLHGGGTFPASQGQWGSKSNDREWMAAKRLGLSYKDEPSLYFVPRMPDDRRGRWYHSGAATAWIRAWQLGVLSGDIDPDRTYILGISEGGYGSFRMGIFFADYFAGAGPMAGAIWKNQEHIENLRNTAFFIGMGEKDFAYDRVNNARDWKLALDSAAKFNKNQFNHVVDIQPARGHGIDYTKAAPWLKQFKRKVYPDTLSMVYYAQCDTISGEEQGRPCYYRKGFGYVRLDKLSKTGERRFYIEKSGNNYNIRSENIKGVVNGSIELYVDRVEFDKKVTVSYNGKRIYNKKVKLNLGTMIESLALFGDPKRIFPASICIMIK